LRSREQLSDFQPKEDRGLLTELKQNWLFLLILIGIGVGAYLYFRPPPPPPPPPYISALWNVPSGAETLRDFQMFTQTGNGTRLSNYYGRPKIIIGYPLECEACMHSLQTLDSIAEDLKGRVDVFPVAISRRIGDLSELILKSYEKYGITNLRAYTITEDDSFGIFNQSAALPHAYILMKDNVIARTAHGPVDWSDPKVMQLVQQMEDMPAPAN